MDVSELLSFQPAKPSKRNPSEAGLYDGSESKRKQQRPVQSQDQSSLSREDKLRLLEMTEEDEEEETDELDPVALKRMLLSFEKCVSRNQEMRVKHPDNPEKFMETELELNEEIQKLHIIATVPAMYHVVIETHSAHTLLGLLHHDNADISLAVVDLLQEMTDVNTLTDSQEGADILISGLLKGQIIGLLVQMLERLNETVPEEAEGVHNALAIVENMSELSHDAVLLAAGEQGLVKWAMKRVTSRQYDPNKLYASEILSILLQTHEQNQKLLGEMNGVDILLQSLSFYKKRDPVLGVEIEAMDNLFDCMCSALTYPPNRPRFLEGEGPQLMLLMLKGKKLAAKPRALKVLDHAMTGAEGAPNCSKFIDIYGLRALFPAFMKVPKDRKDGPTQSQSEEHVCSIIASLLRSTQGQLKDRLYGKFSENGHEKIERLMELHFSYLSQVRQVEEQIRREKKENSADKEDEDEALEENDHYLRRLHGGLYTLQVVDYIVLDLCTGGVASIRDRIARILRTRNSSLSVVKAIMHEYAENVVFDSSGGEGGERQRILSRLKRL